MVLPILAGAAVGCAQGWRRAGLPGCLVGGTIGALPLSKGVKGAITAGTFLYDFLRGRGSDNPNFDQLSYEEPRSIGSDVDNFLEEKDDSFDNYSFDPGKKVTRFADISTV